MTKKIFLVLIPLLMFFAIAYAQPIICPSDCSCVKMADADGKKAAGWTNCPGTEGQYCQPTDAPTGICLKAPTAPSAAEADAGSSSPGDHGWFHDPTSSDIWNEMLQVKITAPNDKDILVRGFTIQALGTGDDSKDIVRAEVWYDKDSDGSVDNDTDLKLDEDSYSQDNGKIVFDFENEQGKIDRGKSKNFVFAYIMNKDAPAGKTYYFQLLKVNATDRATQQSISILNLPINSAVKTMEVGCEGTLTLKLVPSPANINSTVSAAADNLTAKCANRKVTLKTIPCDSLILLAPIGSCTVQANGCVIDFTAPSTPGTYDYYACVDVNGDGDNTDDNEEAKDTLNVVIPEVPAGGAGEGAGAAAEGKPPVEKPAEEAGVEAAEKVAPVIKGAPELVIGGKDYGGPAMILIIGIIIAAIAGYFIRRKRK